MSNKIFQRHDAPDVNVPRNTFDTSHAYHGTFDFGKLYPVYVQEVLPSTSVRINPAFGLKLQPMVFPVQSKIHAKMHYFYVRNRNLWPDWQEYITKTKDGLVCPYREISEATAKSQIGTGSLGDYLGVPSTLAGSYGNTINLRFYNYATTTAGNIDASAMEISTSPIATLNSFATQYLLCPTRSADSLNAPSLETKLERLCSEAATSDKPLWYYFSNSLATPQWVRMVSTPLTSELDPAGSLVISGCNCDLSDSEVVHLSILVTLNSDHPANGRPAGYCKLKFTYSESTNTLTCTDISSLAAVVNSYLFEKALKVGLAFVFDTSTAKVCSSPEYHPNDEGFYNVGVDMSVSAIYSAVKDATDPDVVSFNPFVKHLGEDKPKIKLSALPFLAYESIFNAWYRDDQLMPFKPDGTTIEYNKFTRNNSGGAHSELFDLYKGYLERDYYTSCLTSPQFGEAPLVGISANGTFTFDDGTNTYTAETTIGEDGETITGISTYSDDMPKGTLRRLMDTITNGISINDLRNVNSLQRYLENMQRKAYRYADQIKAHFGVEPNFRFNDLPEFLGGAHEVFNINQISQMSEGSDNSPLGSFAGQGSVVGSSGNISKYCDEHGYIIGILQIIPETTYSQMLPKHFLKTESALDFYSPEFGHIGPQPITYNEVCPLQVAASDEANSTDTINDVFGYQRAWADYMSAQDEIHGDFRLSLSDCVLSRVFDSKPQLGADFIQCDKNAFNDIFAVSDGTDHVLGQIRISASVKQPIPRYGIAKLE